MCAPQVAFLPQGAAAAVSLQRVAPAAQAARFTGRLVVDREEHWRLLPEAAPPHAAAASADAPAAGRADGDGGSSPRLLIGQPTAEQIVASLRARGLLAPTVTRSRGGEGGQDEGEEVVHLDLGGHEPGARIELRSGGGSLLVCRSVETCALLREVVMEALQQI